MLLDQLPDRGTPALTDETVTENGTSLFKTTWLKIRTLFEDRFVRKGRSDHDTYISSSRDIDQPITIWDSYDGQVYGLITSKRYIGLYDSTNSTWIWRMPSFPSEAAYTAWPISMGGTGATTADSAKENLGLGSLKCKTVTFAGNSSKAITVDSSNAGVIITSGASTNIQDIIIFHCASNGSITYTRLRNSTGLTVGTSANTITLTATINVYCYTTVLYY